MTKELLAFFLSTHEGPLKVIITGSREYSGTLVEDILGIIRKSFPHFTLIHGAARGVDTAADQYARSNGLGVVSYPADWSTFGSKAGPIRNSQMLNEQHLPESPTPVDLVLAFPRKGSIGTFDMVAKANKKYIPVFIFPLDTLTLRY